MYDGSVRPLPCDVSKHISDDINVVQDDLFYAVANSLNNETCALKGTETSKS